MDQSVENQVRGIAAKAISQYMTATLKLSLSGGGTEEFEQIRKDTLSLGMMLADKGIGVMRCDRVTDVTYRFEDQEYAGVLVDRLDMALNHAFKGISWMCSGATDFVCEDGTQASEHLIIAGIQCLLFSMGLGGEDKSERSKNLALRVNSLAHTLAAALVVATASKDTPDEELEVRGRQAANAIRRGIIDASTIIASRQAGEHN